MNILIEFSLVIIMGFYPVLASAQPTPVQLNNGPKEAVIGLEELDLETGDLLFFQNKIFQGVLVNLGTLSHITHVAMVVKDPVDGSLWLTHATDNNYNGTGIPVRNENKPRDGVIMTRIKSSFICTPEKPTGFYKKIWVYKMDENRFKRPAAEQVIAFYEKNKHRRFETSSLRFFFSAYDLILLGTDMIAYEENDNRICSEYVHELLTELQFPVEQNQQPNEYTPGDICYMITPLYQIPQLFTFRDGAYRLTEY